MKKYLKISSLLIKLNIEKDLVYSLNTWFLLATTIFYSLAFILSLRFVYMEVSTIMGYTFNQLLLIMLGGQLFWFTHQVFVRKSLQSLSGLINNGKLDMFLSKPISIKRLIIFLEFDQRHIIPSLITLGVIAFMLSDYDLSFWQILGIALFFINGLMISFFFTAIFTFMTFWSGRNTAIFELVMNMVDIVRLPVPFFSPFLKLFFTFIIPAIPIVNPSFQILYNDLHWSLVGETVFVTLVLWVISEFLWHYGLKNYTSAN